jgi:DNA invertase Pin-like site-specific DNA recombinase
MVNRVTLAVCRSLAVRPQLISARTKAALAQAKRRGKRLGGNRGTMPTLKAARKGAAATGKRAAERAADLAPIIFELQERGAASLLAVANGLNTGNIPTARGGGAWSATQVMRVLQRLQQRQDGAG